MITTSVREHPILFSAPMVRAILDGRKTQTRRVVKRTKAPECDLLTAPQWAKPGEAVFLESANPVRGLTLLCRCPYGVPGDRLWVKETHYAFGHWEPVAFSKPRKRKGRQRWKFVPDSSEIRYDAPTDFRKGRHAKDPGTPAWHKRSSLHMPRKASRLTLEITGVRVERLQDISTNDAHAEGYQRESFYRELDKAERIGSLARLTGSKADNPPKKWYSDLWDSINRKGSWAANPWVWVVEFRRVEA